MWVEKKKEKGISSVLAVLDWENLPVLLFPVYIHGMVLCLLLISKGSCRKMPPTGIITMC